MVLSNERNLEAFGPWHSAATLASAIVVLGLVMSWPLERAGTPPPSERQSVSEPCTGGDAVSNFVCRNRWVATLAHNHR
jgi:hypothetical protein